MQGCLRGEELSVSLETSCAHCDQTLHIDIDSASRCYVRETEDGASPLLFEPQIDWERFNKPHIIDDF